MKSWCSMRDRAVMTLYTVGMERGALFRVQAFPGREAGPIMAGNT